MPPLSTVQNSAKIWIKTLVTGLFSLSLFGCHPFKRLEYEFCRLKKQWYTAWRRARESVGADGKKWHSHFNVSGICILLHKLLFGSTQFLKFFSCMFWFLCNLNPQGRRCCLWSENARCNDTSIGDLTGQAWLSSPNGSTRVSMGHSNDIDDHLYTSVCLSFSCINAVCCFILTYGNSTSQIFLENSVRKLGFDVGSGYFGVWKVSWGHAASWDLWWPDYGSATTSCSRLCLDLSGQSNLHLQIMYFILRLIVFLSTK
jgi:hypothetical protein